MAAKSSARPERTNILSLASGLRCKIGDLAIVGGKRAFKENLGCIVEVIGVAFMSDEHGFCWQVRSVGRPMKMAAPCDQSKVWFDNEGVAPDSCLTPIKGIPLDDAEDESADQEINIPAEVH